MSIQSSNNKWPVKFVTSTEAAVHHVWVIYETTWLLDLLLYSAGWLDTFNLFAKILGRGQCTGNISPKDKKDTSDPLFCFAISHLCFLFFPPLLGNLPRKPPPGDPNVRLGLLFNVARILALSVLHRVVHDEPSEQQPQHDNESKPLLAAGVYLREHPPLGGAAQTGEPSILATAF